jgi:hypothetical protein
MGRLIFNIKDLFYKSTDWIFDIGDGVIIPITWVTLILSIILCVMFFSPANQYGSMKGVVFGFFTALMVIISLLEIVIYINGMDDGEWWFVESFDELPMLGEVQRWLKSTGQLIVCYALVMLVAANQLLCFKMLTDNILINAGVNFNVKWWLWPVLVFFGAVVSVIIFLKVLLKRNFPAALCCFLIFSITSMGMAVVMIFFLKAAVNTLFLALIGFIFYGMLAGKSSNNATEEEGDTRYCKTCVHYHPDRNDANRSHYCQVGGRHTDDFATRGDCPHRY